MADGEDVRDLVPDDPSIRLLHIEEGYLIGQKRNFGALQARGELIAHWDDDDYSAPERLANQVRLLATSGKSVVGYNSMHFTDGKDWWLWSHRAPMAIGTSLCYQKQWCRTHPFPALQIGEDGEFKDEALRNEQLAFCAAETLMVASMHKGNTSARQLDGGSYHPVARPEGIGSPFE